MSRKASRSFALRLLEWQRVHGRHGLPWQQTRDPYRVWLSEVMLQQTQVATVRDYFTRFVASFPTVQALAGATQDEVLALWSGLGYYSRARNLHACAQQVVAQHGGSFPRSAKALQALPGIGPSTAAAIAAFCFGERVSIFDGNVKRVLARHQGFAGDLADARQARELWHQADTLVPDDPEDMPSYTQGLMDLGATLCTPRQPRCADCPLASDCQALLTGRVSELPVKTRKLKRSMRHSYLVLVWAGHQVWLTRRPEQGVWGGLWCLPVADDEPGLKALLQSAKVEVPPSAPIKHVLTHFDWLLQPVHARLRRVRKLDDSGAWFALAEALQLGLPKPVRDLLQAAQG